MTNGLYYTIVPVALFVCNKTLMFLLFQKLQPQYIRNFLFLFGHMILLFISSLFGRKQKLGHRNHARIQQRHHHSLYPGLKWPPDLARYKCAI